MNFFHLIWKICGYYFFTYLFLLMTSVFSCLLSCTPITCIWTTEIMVPQGARALLIFYPFVLLLLQFGQCLLQCFKVHWPFCPHMTNLLLIPFSEIFISDIVFSPLESSTLFHLGIFFFSSLCSCFPFDTEHIYIVLKAFSAYPIAAAISGSFCIFLCRLFFYWMLDSVNIMLLNIWNFFFL